MSALPNTQHEIILKTGNDYLVPAGSLEQILATYQLKKQFIEQVLHEGTDYGVTPGTGEKPSLKKAGAEKMASFFGLAPIFESVVTTEDWTGEQHGGEPFFYYWQKCKLYRGERMIGSADGSCNSWEKKYRYRWVSELEIPAGVEKATLRTQGGKTSEFQFAIDKAETSGKYGKPADYWKRWKAAIANGTARPIKRKTKSGGEMAAFEMDATLYAIKNLDVADQTNTFLKMAQKRALVAAVLIVTNASDYFTQDLDDLAADFVTGEIIAGPESPKSEQPTTPAPKAEQTEMPIEGSEQPSTNPDPVPDAMWKSWEALCKRADTAKVEYGKPDRESITRPEMSEAYNELLSKVKAAETPSKA